MMEYYSSVKKWTIDTHKNDAFRCIILNEGNQAQRKHSGWLYILCIREKSKLIGAENNQWLALGLGDNQGVA